MSAHSPVSIRERVLYGNRRGGKVEIPDWFVTSFMNIYAQITNEEYPCTFATLAEKRGELLFTYIERERGYAHLPETLAQFLQIFSVHPDRLFALVILFQPEEGERELASYHQTFWDMLQFLHEHDPSSWHPQIPRNPDARDWLFVYNGIPAFPFVLAPAYQKRKSRNLGSGMAVVYTPVTEIERTSDGASTRNILRSIRQRVQRWDNCTAYQEEVNSENERYGWRFMSLPDRNVPVAGTCPFRFEKEHIE